MNIESAGEFRIPLEGAADHGVSESIYLRAPTTMELNCIAIRKYGPALQTAN